MKTHSLGWFATFAALVVTAYLAIHYFTGEDAVGAATRFVWNALAFAVNSFIRLFGGLAVVLAKGIGVRRVSRLAKLLTGVGLGYAGSVILNDERLRRARGWRGRLKAAITLARNRWQRLHLVWKLVIVAALIASRSICTSCSSSFRSPSWCPWSGGCGSRPPICFLEPGTGGLSGACTGPRYLPRSRRSPVGASLPAPCGSGASATCAPGGFGIRSALS